MKTSICATTSLLKCAAAALILSSTVSHAFSPLPTSTLQQRVHARASERTSGSSQLFSSVAASLPEGLSKTVVKPGSGRPLNFGDVATVRYTCSVPGASQPFARSNSQKVIVGDGIMVRGWDTALQSMTVGEKATVLVTDPERFGYGAEGIPPFVPPNAQLEMEIELLGAEDGADLATLATSDPLKPVSQYFCIHMIGSLNSVPLEVDSVDLFYCYYTMFKLLTITLFYSSFDIITENSRCHRRGVQNTAAAGSDR